MNVTTFGIFLVVLFLHVVTARLPRNSSSTLQDRSRRKTQVNPCSELVYPEEAQISLQLTQQFLLDKVNVTKELSDLVNREEFGRIEDLIDSQRQIYERFHGFSDFNDQALVAKTKDTQICFATFQSSDPGNGMVAFLFDQWQNVNPFTSRVGGSDCRVRNGYLNAYNSSRYKKALRKSIDDCVHSCVGTITSGGDTPCELVLGGFSQGGSAAVVAAMDLAHYNPEVITFGTARVVLVDSELPCTASIDESRHYRFVATNQGAYDVIPNQHDVYKERHVGHLLLLDDGVNFPLAMPKMSDTERRSPTSWQLHDFQLYRKYIEDMLNRGCYPVPLAKWPDGHYCHASDECGDGLHCDDNLNECKRL